MGIKQPTDEELKAFLLKKYTEEIMNKMLEHDTDQANKSTKKAINKYKDRLMQVTPELFFEFLVTKGVSLKCNSCGAEELSVPEGSFVDSEKVPDNFSELDEAQKREVMNQATTRYVSYTILDKNKDSLHGLLRSYYRVHCLNCGNLSLYRSSSVLQWFEKSKGEQPDE
ncbi:hypothetical protein ABTW46_03085 [Morganella morganii]|uniref:hypothetical protein n=1 Tax=Morganella morganii TaxID=582 RepID=UPI003315C6FD